MVVKFESRRIITFGKLQIPQLKNLNIQILLTGIPTFLSSTS